MANRYLCASSFPSFSSVCLPVLLIALLHVTAAQFLGPQTVRDSLQFPSLDLNQRRQLSPQQQGHILSDIQQHQHRFNLHQNVLNNPPPAQTFQPQQFNNRQPIVQQQQQQQTQQQQHVLFNQPNLFNQQQQQQQQGALLLQPQSQPLFNQQHQHHFTQQDLINAAQQQNQQQQLLSVPLTAATAPAAQQQLLNQQPQSLFNNQVLFPTIAPQFNQQQNRFVQHHTQTSFTPIINNNNNNNNNNIKKVTLQPTLSTFNASLFSPKFQAPPLPENIFNLDAIQNQNQQPLDPEKQKQRLKELKEKQAIIEKHNQFVEKQYKKALEKAQTDHNSFLETQKEHKKKLYQTLYKPTAYENVRFSPATNARFLYPEESYLFKQAIEEYYKEHPTTTTTTTTTTAAPTTTTTATTTTTEAAESRKSLPTESDEQLYLNSDHSKLFSQLKLATQLKNSQSFLPTIQPTQVAKPIQSLDDLTQLQKQYKSQQINKDDLLAQLRLAIGANANDEDVLSKNVTSREISLPNGQKVQIIRTSDPSLIPGAQPLDLNALHLDGGTKHKAPKAILDELTKGVLPPGADFDLLKQGTSGLEQVKGGIPTNQNGKKVTFVLLEEQSDGSFKVQGVKGNGDKDAKSQQVDVDSILKSIKNGDIKLPPNVKFDSVSSTTATFPTTSQRPVVVTSTTTKQPIRSLHDDRSEGISVLPNSEATSDVYSQGPPVLKTNIGTHFVSTTVPSSSRTTPRSLINFSSTTPIASFDSLRISTTPNDLIRQASTAGPAFKQNSIFSSVSYGGSSSSTPQPTTPTYKTSYVTTYKSPSSVKPFTTTTTIQEQSRQLSSSSSYNNSDGFFELPEVLKNNGLFAMAKFLRQSGLDTILNETGPYTVFAPTDKAFRTLLVQLGGPEKAEEKFKDNPRLLSGLLLHHVIPGAFKIDQLQDEMTGVSLAGTQLRVNQYNMHDLEWNDIKVTTINGAKVLDDKWDIAIPQGIAHGVDRVMFPLPVGDIVQTLQSDRERRFTTFLRALFASGLASTLQGTKTFTLFAPTDRAFATMSTDELSRTVSDRTAARQLVMRHITPTTLFTNGMRYYQIRDSLEQGKQITLSKSSGRIKVNNLSLATQNIPATNGVIHAIDSLL